MPNTFDWIEIRSADPAKTLAFYKSVFGWKLLETDSADGSDVKIFDTGGEPRTENLRRGGIWAWPQKDRAGVIVYIFVSSIDETLRRVVEMGGKIIAAKTPQGRNFRAYFADPSGNELGLWEEAGE